MGMRGMHRMNGTTFPVATSEERLADGRRSLRLWLLIGFLTLAWTALAIITPFP